MIRLRALIKWLLFAVVIGYVCHHGYRLWFQSDVHPAPLTASGIGWLVAAGIVYTLSWLPSAWFWREIMGALGGHVGFGDAARAYYCGHLGKYVPGKAMVLVIRSALVKDRGCAPVPAAIAVAFETLTMMGTGLALGGALAPLLFPDWMANLVGDVLTLSPAWQSAILTAAVTLLVAGSLPLISKLMTLIAARATPGAVKGEVERLHVRASLIGVGSAAFVVSWAFQGLSLGMILHGVAGVSFDLVDWPLWTGATALSTAAGFAILFAPGGLGVREGILLGILSAQPGISPQAAVAATLLSRVVSFLAEITVSALLFTTVRGRVEPAAAEPRGGRGPETDQSL